MKPTTISRCISKRELLKKDVWDTKIRQTTASRHIRAHADQELTMHGINLNVCSVCGSISHTGLIDVAHIKASSSFSDDAPLGQINHIDNLLTMCKNCHRKYDRSQHDELWSEHLFRVIAAIQKQKDLICYVDSDLEYESPVDLDKMRLLAQCPTYYETFFHCDEPFVIPNTGRSYFLSDEKLFLLRNKTFGEMTNSENTNGSPYFLPRQHAKSEAYKHDMYDDYKCIMCGENTVCDLSHAHRLCDIPEYTPMGIVNHIHNLIWLCPNHNHLLDNPPTKSVSDQYWKEYNWFIQSLQNKLSIHREKYKQIPINNQSFLYNPVSINNWKVLNH